MFSDVMQDVTLQEVTPAAGKGTLGTWRGLDRSRTQCRDKIGH